MRKFYGKTIGYLFVFVGILLSSGSLLSQVTAVPIAMPECTSTVPGYEIDLSANPNLTFTTPEILRQVGCCGDGDRYLAFYVTLNPNVAMIEIVVAPGYADPGGSGNYQIVTGGDLNTPGTCGPEIDAGTPLCITGAGPHKILYSKPGGNLTKYIFRQIPSPVYPSNQPTRLGCTLPLPIYGLNNISITATSTTSSASLATCNTYMSCLNCADPVFSPGANATYPYDITYQVTGTPQAAACGVYPTSGSFTVTVYDELNVSVSPNPASYCSGGAGALLTASATGGFGAYSYLWFNSDGDTVSTINTYLADTAGTYTAQVKDGLITATCPGDYISVPVTISPVPVVTAGPDQTVCATSPTVFLSGTSSTSSGVWSGGTGTYSPNAASLLTSYTPSASEINAGSVTLTLTSSNAGPGCSNNTDQVTINFSDTVYAAPSAAEIACYNSSTTINANPSGGTLPYTYAWSNGTVGSSITATAGTYSVTVTDAIGCSDNTPITISQPSPLGLNFINTLDGGTCDGSATVSVTGGTSPYTYLWSTGGTTNTITNQCAGVYSVTVTDANLCTLTQNVVINNATCSAFNANVATHTDVDCFNGSNGTATASTVGGVGTITYLWSPGGQTTQTATNLASGTYTVMATDGNGCVDYASVSILQPTVITNTMTHTDVTTIGGSDGTATANPLGGTPGYTYSWVPGGQTTQTATNLTSGVGGVVYYVDITDSKSCVKEDSVIINQPPCQNFVLAVNTTNVTCNGLSNGSASLVIANGTGPFTISWSNGASNVTSVSGLAANTYTVTVTDASNCTTFQSFTITQPNVLSLGLVPTNITCFDDQDGTIDLTVTGGTYPFSYSWSLGGKVIANHEDLSQLVPGTYTVTVTDMNGCTAIGSVGVTQPTKLTATYTYTNNPCFGNSLGTVDLTPTGGVFPYTYSWTGPSPFTSSSQDLSGLATGGYALTLTDLNGCTYQTNVNINQPDLLTASAVVVDSVSCAGGNDGTLNLTVAGGTLPYSYAWTGPASYTSTTEDPSGLAAGTYNVTVTDDEGCTATTSIVMPTIADTTDPVITCLGNQAVNTSSTACTYTHSGTAWNATATDNCIVSSIGYVLTGVTTGSGTNLNGVAFNLGVTTVTWTATDGLGNTDVCSYTVTVTDLTSPTALTCSTIGNQIVPANPGVCTYTHSGTAWNATATDNCSIASGTYALTGVTTGTGTSLNGVVFNLGLTTVTWTFTDGSGNSASCSYTVTVNDTQNPTALNCATIGNQTVPANAGVCTYTHAGTAWNATASDNCSIASITYALTGVTTGTGTSLNGVVFNLGLTTVTWTATDGSGNTSTCSYTVTVTDTQNPTALNCATIGNQTVPANVGLCTYTHNNNTWNVTASDNCSIASITYALTGVTTGTGTSLNGVVFNLGLTTVTWTATDGSGNSSSCSYTVTVTDTQNPTALNCSTIGNQSVLANTGVCTYTHAGTAWNASGSDNCSIASITYALSGVTTGTGTSLNGVVFNLGLTTVTWTATDGSGNTSTCSYTVTVSDNQVPSILTCGAGNQSVLANTGVCTYTNSGTAWNATASDNCSVATILYTLSGATTGTGASLNGVVFNLGTTTVLWTATDGSGNTSTCTFTVTVTDNQIPSILSCGVTGNQTVNANTGICTYTHPNNLWNASATDNCSVATLTYALTGATTGTGTTLSGKVFNLGVTTVTWTATDGSGNSTTCTFTVTVVDNQNPIITSCGPNLNQTVITDASQCNFTQTTTAWNATASDNCSLASLVYTLTGATTGTGTSLQGVDFNLGTTTVTWTATDGSGNTSTCSFQVLVLDNQLPVISSCGATGTQNVFSNTGVCTFTQTGTGWNAIATDNCTVSSLTYTLTGATTGTGTTLNGVVFNPGITTVTWTAVDNSSNTSTCTFNVIVSDNQNPIISGCPTNITVGTDNGDCGAIVTWTAPTFTDNCGATMTSNHNSGEFFAVGTTTVTYTVTDATGNTSICTFTVTVNDDENPAMTCSSAIATCNPVVTFAAPIVSDNCGVLSTIQTAGLPSGSTFPVGTTVNSFQTTDIHGNVSTCSFNVTIFPTPVATTAVTDVTCNGFANGIIDLTVTTGTTPYDYAWSNGALTEDLSNLAPGTYSVNITDDNGCTTSASASITQPNVLVLTAEVDDVNCYNGNDGAIDITITGGTTPYDYTWSNGQTSQDIVGLTEDFYSVSVVDFNGCTVNFSDSIVQPDTLMIQAVINDATCNSDNGSIQVLVTGGTTPYSYDWSNGSAGLNLNNVVAGTYTLTVTDVQNCSVQYTGTIASVSNLQAYTIVKDAMCYGAENGQVQVIVENGNLPYTFEWSNGTENALADNLAAGTYSVLITDVFGCTLTLDVDVNQPDSMYIELTTSSYVSGTNISTFGNDDGWITSEVFGGNSPYSYIWSNGETTENVTNLSAGNYSLIVTDQNGCVAYASSRLTQPGVLEMPSGFSPNADLSNDYFVVHGLEAYPENKIIIFNRWGNVVYEIDNYANEWNGDNMNGEPLPDGTYFVILTVYAEEDITLNGYVDLRR